MEINIQWIDGMAFQAKTGSGHDLIMDGPSELGGQNLGARPMEMLLAGILGCTCIDVVHILKKARQPIENCQAKICATRADTDPKVFTKLHIHFLITGNDLSEVQVKRAIDLSAEKYCSASIMMSRAGVAVTHEYQILSS